MSHELKRYGCGALIFIAGSAAAAGTQHDSVPSQMATLVLQLAAIYLAARLLGDLFEHWRLPSVLGELTAGILIGPYLLGVVPLPGLPQGIFPVASGLPVTMELYGITTVGSILLLFIVGLETDLATFLRYSVVGSLVGIGGVVFSFVAGDLVAVFFAQQLLGQPASFMDPVPLFLGVVSTATSVGISARILSEKRKMGDPEGVTILAGAVIDDVLGIIVLAIVVGVAHHGHPQWSTVAAMGGKAIAVWLGFTAAGLLLAPWLARQLGRFRRADSIALASLSLALLLAAVFEKSGLAMIVGAYVMGLSLSRTDLALMIKDQLAVLQRFLIPVFFGVMGMLVDLRALENGQVLMIAAVYTVLAILAKIIGCSVPALFCNFNLRGALRIGVGMVPRGEVALIIAGIGLASGILHGKGFAVAIVMTFVTTMLTPALFAWLLSDDRAVLRHVDSNAPQAIDLVFELPDAETLDVLVNRILSGFEVEGFYVHRIDLPQPVFHLTRGQHYVVMRSQGTALVFECSSSTVALVNTVFYEEVAELAHVMTQLGLLTDPSDVREHTSVVSTDSVAPSKHLAAALSIEAIVLPLAAGPKNTAIADLIERLVATGALPASNRDEALADVLERESNMSTGMQDGVALPHARTHAVDCLVCAVGICPAGIAFDSLDGKPAQIVLLTLVPRAQTQPYLRFIAAVSSFLMNAENRQALMNAKSPAELHRVFAGIDVPVLAPNVA